MSQATQAAFQGLFNASLQDYEDQTGTSLINHPFSEQLEACNSVDSITVILQGPSKIIQKFKGDDGKLMKSLKCSVDVLYTLSTSTILGGGIGIVCQKAFIGVPWLNSYSKAFPPATAIFTGIAILLGVCLS